MTPFKIEFIFYSTISNYNSKVFTIFSNNTSYLGILQNSKNHWRRCRRAKVNFSDPLENWILHIIGLFLIILRKFWQYFPIPLLISASYKIPKVIEGDVVGQKCNSLTPFKIKFYIFNYNLKVLTIFSNNTSFSSNGEVPNFGLISTYFALLGSYGLKNAQNSLIVLRKAPLGPLNSKMGC